MKTSRNEVLFYRFDEIPDDERSSIWHGEEKVGKEDGVSVYEAHVNLNGEYVPVLPYPPTVHTLDTFYALLRYSNVSRYLVTGDVVGVGSDNEPLIRNVKIIKKLK